MKVYIVLKIARPGAHIEDVLQVFDTYELAKKFVGQLDEYNYRFQIIEREFKEIL